MSAIGTLIAVDIGGTRVRIGHAVDGVPGKRFDALSSRRLDVALPHEVLAPAIAAHAAPLGRRIDAVVLGIPGMIDRDSDEISGCNNMPSLHGQHLRKGLAMALECRVLLEQDIMLQLLGEQQVGAAAGSQDLFGVYFGTGIGSAFLRDGDPLRARAASLQAGHVPVGLAGVPCACGNTDCVEAYASGRTLEALASEHRVPLEALFLHRGNRTLDAALERFLRYQAGLLATVSLLLAPERIVIGGGIPAMAGYPRDRLLDHAIAHLQRPRPSPDALFAFASLGEAASLYGAARLLELVPEVR